MVDIDTMCTVCIMCTEPIGVASHVEISQLYLSWYECIMCTNTVTRICLYHVLYLDFYQIQIIVWILFMWFYSVHSYR